MIETNGDARDGLAVDEALPDERLAAHALGDRDAFAVLYRRYVRRIYAYARRRVWSDTEAEEVTAEVFLAALAGLHTFGGQHDFTFRSWLFRVTKRKRGGVFLSHEPGEEDASILC